MDGQGIGGGGPVAGRDQAFDLRGEEQPAAIIDHVVERFHSKTVAGQQQAVGGLVPQRHGEDAVEAGEDIGAPLLIAVDEHLGIGLRAELVPRAS